jgi:TolA-binding protein
LNNLKRNKEHLLYQMHEAESRARLAAHRDEVERMYQLGRQYLTSGDYLKAQNEFLAVENLALDYKSTRRYLKRIEGNLNVPMAAEGTVEQNKSRPLTAAQIEQEKLHNTELQQQATLQNLAQKASDINDDIIVLSRQQDYDGMKAKFTELENTISALTSLKETMSYQKDQRKREQHEQQVTLASIRQHVEGRPQTQASQQVDSDVYKRKEMTQEKNMMFNEGVELYREGKYMQAKYLFAELADQHDRRGDAWLKKADRAINQDVVRRQAKEERERSEYLADQIRAQRELIKMQERERQHQKQLAEELERQRRQFEEQREMQIRKEETLKAQEREREIQEEKRVQAEKEIEKEQEQLRFRKIETGSPVAQQPMQAVPGVPNVPTQAAAAAAPSLEPETQAQLEARRERVRKQLEDGVEAMYQEALSLYKQGDYADAAAKFKDVQDIIPGYKDSGQYVDDSLSKSMQSVSPHTVEVSPDPSQVPASPSVSHQDAVSKALDLFDPNAK